MLGPLPAIRAPFTPSAITCAPAGPFATQPFHFGSALLRSYSTISAGAAAGSADFIGSGGFAATVADGFADSTGRALDDALGLGALPLFPQPTTSRPTSPNTYDEE